MKPKMSADSKKVQNIPSNLLSQEENQKIFYALGKPCTTLATSVVQLFVTEEPYHTTWVKKLCGVICFVKDCDRRSYFFKIFDMEKCSWIWEQELYNQFTYKPTCTFFHMFEADNCMAGLNFASNEEAHEFKSTVQKKIQEREMRKQRRRAQQTILPSNTGIVAARGKSESMPSLPNGKEGKKERKKKKKLTKEDISNPTNFTHVQHVGWHPDKGFSVDRVDDVDKELQDFFNLAGVSDRDLHDCDTRNFIYDFINNHGGVERVKQEIIQKSSPPPVPTREAPQTPRPPRLPSTRCAAPPPPPSVPPAAQPPPPSIPKHSVAPPPPPPPPPPQPMQLSVPPPPPPPPPPSSGMERTAVSSTVIHQVNPIPPMDNRSALLDQIRKGKELHHVEINEVDNNTSASNDDARGALLNQIRQGIVLKSVSEEAKPVLQTPQMDGLAGALARALLERSRAIQQTDESGSSSEDDDGDEWD